MRNVVCSSAALLLLTCTTVGAFAVRPFKDAPAAPQPKVYLDIKGQERLAKRFAKFLEIALDDYNLQRIDSSRGADFTIRAEIKDQDGTKDLYAPLVHFILSSHNDKDRMVNLCSTVSTSESVYKDKLTFLPVTLPPEVVSKNPHLSVYIDQPSAKAAELIPLLKKGLQDGNFKIALSPAEADAQIKDLQLQRLSVPMRVTNRSITFDVLDKDSRFYYTSGSGYSDTFYIEPTIKVEGLPCADTFLHFQDSTDNTSWRDAARIAKSIRERVDKEAKRK